jgi:hypothetical protein
MWFISLKKFQKEKCNLKIHYNEKDLTKFYEMASNIYFKVTTRCGKWLSTRIHHSIYIENNSNIGVIK